MSDPLFSDFDEISAKAWKQKIQVDLKGADYNESLISKTAEGIHIKPFYHQDEFDTSFAPIPGHPTSWNITQSIFVDDTTVANRLALNAIERGAEALLFVAEKEFDAAALFSDFPLERVPVYFDLKFLSETFYVQLIAFCEQNKIDARLRLDLIGNLARTGNWFHNLKEDHKVLETVVSHSPDRTLGVDTSLYQNAGAHIVQQLAYGLAQANEYLNHFTGTPISITFTVAIGYNYFFEIAKIRALRKLYAVLAKEYNVPENCTILAVPSRRNKTLYDYNVNMLRTTTEYMSAALGGANAVCSLPYDAIYHKRNEFGDRISRNQMLILKSESYFDLVSNAADGTYYIESLTQELAEKALQLFKNIESGGGLLAQLKAGTIQRKIKESAQQEQERFTKGELVLIGTNKYPNEADRMKNDLELYPFVKIQPRKTLIAPIIEKRLSEALENRTSET